MTMSPTGSRGPSGNIIPKGYKAGQLQQFTPEQMNLFQNLFSQVSPNSNLSQLAAGSEEAFRPMEERAMKDFQKFSGLLGSRFAGSGMGGIHSGAFQRQATQGAQDFASMLKEQRQGLQRQALMDLMGISGSLLGQHPYEQFLVPKKKPFWQELVSGLSGGLGSAAGTLGGIWGANKLGLT